MLSPGAIRILKELAADDGCYLIRDGIYAYCGRRAVASRTVSELVWAAAVTPIAPSEGGATYYSISDMGRRYIRRPELADEYRAWVMCRRGSFTVTTDDHIVPLDN